MRLSLARREWAVGWITATALILAATIKAAEPALLGEWVYDDRALPVSAALDDMSDVRAAFSRSSEDYFGALRDPGSSGSTPVATGVTYRPLPMLSLSFVNAALGPEPLYHHLLSALFHVGCVLLLAWRFCEAGQLTRRGWFVVTLFAAHPSLVEAWGWINGRSDVMAGLALLALDASQRQRVPNRYHWGLSALFLSAGALCKETFVVAAAFLLLSAQLRRARDGEATSGTWLASGSLWLVTTSAMLATRHVITGGAGVAELDLSKALASCAHLMSLGLEALAVPRARSMRLLSWELFSAWSTAQVLLSCLAALGLLAVLRARRWDRLALLVGAGATLLPALLIGGGFWFGFDRYLYMPAILIALAGVPNNTEVRHARQPSQWLVTGSYVVISASLLLATRTASAVYASQDAFERSMIALRPADPSGYLNAFREAAMRGDQADARHVLEAMPTRALPLPHAHRAVSAWQTLGEPERAAQIAEAALRVHGPEPRLLIGLAKTRAGQGRWEETSTLLQRAYDTTPITRPAVVAALEHTLEELAGPQVPPGVAARLNALAARVRDMRESASTR